jgi:hypothetical protein
MRGTDYSDALERVIENLARRYSIGFIPNVALRDGGFHDLNVSVRSSAAPGHQKLEVRARRGYVAGALSGGAER